MADYYETLGVPREASPEQIKKAFRERAFRHHPDRNPGNPAAEEEFKKINEAYSILGDPEKKTRYDLGGSAADNPYASRPYGQNPYGDTYENPFGQYTWTWTSYGAGRPEPQYTRRDAFEMLLRNILTLVAGIVLFRFSAFFGIFGVLICITAIGKGFMNSLRAIALLINLKK